MCNKNWPQMWGNSLCFFSAFRCDGHHLRSSQQQLQHGDQRRQSDQQTTGSPQPFQEHLEQQVSILKSRRVFVSGFCNNKISNKLYFSSSIIVFNFFLMLISVTFCSTQGDKRGENEALLKNRHTKKMHTAYKSTSVQKQMCLQCYPTFTINF